MQKRNLEELNLLDDFLMCSVLSYPGIGPEVCRRMASIILEREIRQIRIVPQKVYFGADTDRHGIRLDVYAEESREENAKDADLMAIHQMVQKVKHDREVSLEYMKIFERERMIREDGYTSGKEAELIGIIRRKRGKGLSAKEIAEWLELDEVYVQNVVDLLEKNPDADDPEIGQMCRENRN